MVLRNAEEGRLRFATDLADCLADVQVVFIAVGTRPERTARPIFPACSPWPTRSGRSSTITKWSSPSRRCRLARPTGFRQAIQEELVRRGATIEFDVVSNPNSSRRGRPLRIS